MARVYVALRDGAYQICVLKQLLGDLAGNEVAARRFLREAQLAAYLLHPNVGLVQGAGFEDGKFCIAFEFIQGLDLEAMSYAMLEKRQLLPYPVSVSAIAGILTGLGFAHSALDPEGKPLRLVHRDLSPRNMMLAFDGVAKVIDFGLARGRLDDFQTAPGTIMGTLRFCSPEQVMAMPVDARSDLYSVGVVLFEILTGQILVKPGKPLEVVKSVVSLEAPPVSSVNTQLPKELDGVIAKALAKRPEDRWATAEEFRGALIEATGDWTMTPTSDIAAFLAQEFAGARARTEEFKALGRAAIAETATAGAPVAELSAVVPQPLPEAAQETLRTLTAYEHLAPAFAKALEAQAHPSASVHRLPVAERADPPPDSPTDPGPASAAPPEQAKRAERNREVAATPHANREVWRGRLQGALIAGVVIGGAAAFHSRFTSPPSAQPVAAPIAARPKPLAAAPTEEPELPPPPLVAPALAPPPETAEQDRVQPAQNATPDETPRRDRRASSRPPPPDTTNAQPSVRSAQASLQARRAEILGLVKRLRQGDTGVMKRLRRAFLDALAELPESSAASQLRSSLAALDGAPAWEPEHFERLLRELDAAIGAR